GAVYVTGSTESADFPVTADAAQPRYLGKPDTGEAFVANYDSDGHLRWATYLGGAYRAAGGGIVADNQGHIYVTGPVTGAADPPRYRGLTDAFVASYNGDGGLRWATSLGGSFTEYGQPITTDGRGGVYVTGYTLSPDFPVTPGAAQPRYGGGDAFGGDAF